MEKTTCPHCGNPVDTGARACPACGGDPGPGIPWDERKRIGTLAAAFESCRLILSSPSTFFRRMRRETGHVSPILFCLLLNFVGALFAGIWSLAISPEVTERAIVESLPPGLDIEALGGPTAVHRIMLAVSVTIGPLASIAGLYLWTGAMTLMLHLLRVEGRDFHTTLRITSYANAMQVGLLLPILGSLFALIGTLVVMAIGLRVRYDIGGGKAALVTLAFPLGFMALAGMLAGGLSYLP